MPNPKRITEAGGGSPSRNRWRHLLATRQPDAVIDAFKRIAKKRNTTVSALLGEAAVQIVVDGRGELPLKLQHQLRNLGAERPPFGRPVAKAARLKPTV